MRRSRGGIAVDLALGMPVLLFLVLGGSQLGRALVSRHRLADATGFAARAAAVSGRTDPASVRASVQERMGIEGVRCTGLDVQAVVVPGSTPGGTIQVTTVC